MTRTTLTRSTRSTARARWPLCSCRWRQLARARCGCGAPAPSKPAAPQRPALEPPRSRSPSPTTRAAPSPSKAEPQRIVSLAPANTEIAFALGPGRQGRRRHHLRRLPRRGHEHRQGRRLREPQHRGHRRGQARPRPRDHGRAGRRGHQARGPRRDRRRHRPAERSPASTPTSSASARPPAPSAKADELVADMKADVAAVQKAVAGTAPVTAFVEIGQNPLYTVGHGHADRRARHARRRQERRDAARLRRLLGRAAHQGRPAGLPGDQGLDERPERARRSAPGFDKLAAVKNGRVVILDDNLVSRPGPRVVAGPQADRRGAAPRRLRGQVARR